MSLIFWSEFMGIAELGDKFVGAIPLCSGVKLKRGEICQAPDLAFLSLKQPRCSHPFKNLVTPIK
jgi:hypothetical protein